MMIPNWRLNVLFLRLVQVHLVGPAVPSRMYVRGQRRAVTHTTECPAR